MRTENGILEIKVPRNRQGEFEPAIIAKHQKEFKGFDDKILSMYSRGMTTREIQGHLKGIYAIDVSPDLISRVTDSVKEMLDEWRGRSLESFYPVLFLDAIRINIRENGQIIKKAVYLALAIRMDG